MYVGSYLEENIGHEVINLFRDDHGNNYIYVNISLGFPKQNEFYIPRAGRTGRIGKDGTVYA